jgi:hypothetical protein
VFLAVEALLSGSAGGEGVWIFIVEEPPRSTRLRLAALPGALMMLHFLLCSWQLAKVVTSLPGKRNN